VIAITAFGDALCFCEARGGIGMFEVLTDESWRNGALIEERNEKPLRIALFAVIAAWSIAMMIALL
jgi:hypothetical protein